MRLQAYKAALVSLLCMATFFGCSEDSSNTPPVIQSVTSSDMNPGAMTTIVLTCVASDADGDNLSYAWTANGVSIGDNAAIINWQAPAVNGAITIVVVVSDGSEEASKSLVIRNEFFQLTALTDVQFSGWNSDWLRPASYVNQHREDLYIVDLRTAGAFGVSHISGAHNLTLALVADSASAYSGGREVALVCETGQVAAFATMGLRMLGIDAFCMKWGMAGWNDLLASPWDAGISNAYSTLMSNDASPTLPINGWPSLHTGLSSSQAILQARIDVIFAEGYGQNSVTAYEVMDNPASFRIHNYWLNQDYEDLGHIAGSYQVTPGTLTTDQDLSALDPAHTNVLYCWTGQTSSFVGFYLNVLGYDLVSLQFGANALMHDDLTQEKWEHQQNNYPTVTN